jgi:hypothetical protein
MDDFTVLPSFSPRGYGYRFAGPEEAKNLAGQKGPLPDSDPFSEGNSAQNRA